MKPDDSDIEQEALAPCSRLPANRRELVENDLAGSACLGIRHAFPFAAWEGCMKQPGNPTLPHWPHRNRIQPVSATYGARLSHLNVVPRHNWGVLGCQSTLVKLSKALLVHTNETCTKKTTSRSINPSQNGHMLVATI